MDAVPQRRNRAIRDTCPVPPQALPCSGANPKIHIAPKLDIWLRLHPPGGPGELAVLVLLVMALVAAVAL